MSSDRDLAHRIGGAQWPSGHETGQEQVRCNAPGIPGAGSQLVGEGSDVLQGHLDRNEQVMGAAARLRSEITALHSCDETGGEGIRVRVVAQPATFLQLSHCCGKQSAPSREVACGLCADAFVLIGQPCDHHPQCPTGWVARSPARCDQTVAPRIEARHAGDLRQLPTLSFHQCSRQIIGISVHAGFLSKSARGQLVSMISGRRSPGAAFSAVTSRRRTDSLRADVTPSRKGLYSPLCVGWCCDTIDFNGYFVS